MNARKPKPSALKERTSHRSLFDLSRLFASANDIVSSNPEPRQVVAPQYVSKLDGAPSDSFPSASDLDDKTMKLNDPKAEPPGLVSRQETTNISIKISRPKTRAAPAPIRANTQSFGVTRASRLNQANETPEPTRVQRAPDDLTVTRATTVKPLPPYDPVAEAAKEQAAARARREAALAKVEAAERRRTVVLAVALIGGAVALIGYATLSPLDGARRTATNESRLTHEQIEERLAFHRQLTGSRLNRERIDVQLTNHIDAPELAGDAQKIRAPNMMDGVPLAGEANPAQKNERPDWPVNPSHPDAKIMYGLQEEQDRIYFEKQARKAWLKEFVENARKDGVKVEIDPNGYVRTSPLPANEREPSAIEMGSGPDGSADPSLDR